MSTEPRQISDILELDEDTIEDKIPALVDFQCIKRSNQGEEEKYSVNDEIHLLTKSLALEHTEVANDIEQKIIKNFTLEKRMNYTSEEEEILSIFNSYLREKHFLRAENFIQGELHDNPNSNLLKYHYAQYLKDHKKDLTKAIKILEGIVGSGYDHPNILRLLVSCFKSLDVPNFNRANIYVDELRNSPLSSDENIKLEIAEFYIDWATSIRLKMNIDYIEDIKRIQKYQDIARLASELLENIENKTDKVYYLIAYSYFHQWQYEEAEMMVDLAINISRTDKEYYVLKELIVEKMKKYSRKHVAGLKTA